MPRNLYIQTDLGTEKRCPMCTDYFPFDEEFFFKNGQKNGIQQLSTRCKACYMQSYRMGADI